MIEIMQSIRPEWCSLIFSGYKDIELRKRRPKCKTPFKVYIYCTKNGVFLVHSKTNPACSKNEIQKYGGKVIGEYVCDEIYNIWAGYAGNCGDDCLSYSEREAYLGDYGMGYGWHISDLKIYDAPKELSEFEIRKDYGTWFTWKKVERAPQDWCYVRRIKE